MDVDVDSDNDKDTTHDDSGKKESRIDPRVAAPEKEEKLTAKAKKENVVRSGRLEFVLFPQLAPRAAENFRLRCEGKQRSFSSFSSTDGGAREKDDSDMGQSASGDAIARESTTTTTTTTKAGSMLTLEGLFFRHISGENVIDVRPELDEMKPGSRIDTTTTTTNPRSHPHLSNPFPSTESVFGGLYRVDTPILRSNRAGLLGVEWKSPDDTLGVNFSLLMAPMDSRESTEETEETSTQYVVFGELVDGMDLATEIADLLGVSSHGSSNHESEDAGKEDLEEKDRPSWNTPSAKLPTMHKKATKWEDYQPPNEFNLDKTVETTKDGTKPTTGHDMASDTSTTQKDNQDTAPSSTTTSTATNKTTLSYPGAQKTYVVRVVKGRMVRNGTLPVDLFQGLVPEEEISTAPREEYAKLAQERREMEEKKSEESQSGAKKAVVMGKDAEMHDTKKEGVMSRGGMEKKKKQGKAMTGGGGERSPPKMLNQTEIAGGGPRSAGKPAMMPRTD